MARGHWGWSPHIKGSRKLVEQEGERTMTQRDELEDRITELTVENATAHLQAINADLLAALKAVLPILTVAHDRGFAIKEVEPVYNQTVAAIEKAEGN